MQGSYMCSVCAVSFDEQPLRREHMRHPWHVFNLKRRLLEEPSISLTEFEDNHSTQEVVPEQETPPKAQSPNAERLSHRDTGLEDWHEILPTRCLFCRKQAVTINANLVHMASAHSFHIPELDQLQTDVETLIDYLRCVIHEFNSCLYCGLVKYSGEAAKAHMISKGHCMLDMSEGSEFLDFWMVGLLPEEASKKGEDEDNAPNKTVDGGPKKLSQTEMLLPSGSRVFARGESSRSFAKRSSASSQMGTSLRTAEARKHSSPSSSTSIARDHTRSLALRDTMGLIGLPDHQRRALAATQHKIMKREHRAMLQQRWIVEKIANRQKNFKPDVPGPKNG